MKHTHKNKHQVPKEDTMRKKGTRERRKRLQNRTQQNGETKFSPMNN